MDPTAPAPSSPNGRQRAGTPPRRITWFLLGALAVLGARQLTNRLSWPDYLMRPLLVGDTAGHADVIVVPGAGLSDACTPNLNAVRRTLLAARLYRAGRAPLILISGGRPRAGDLRCTVASVMAQLAVEIGVPPEAVRIERESRTTHKNAELSAPILRELGAKRILIVTDRLHMVRATAAYAHYGFAIERASVPVYEGHRDNVEMLLAGFREMIAIEWYRYKGWIDNPWASPSGTGAAATALPDAGRDARVMGASVGGAAPRETVMPQTPSPPQASTSPAPPQRLEGPLVVLGASYAAGWKVPSLGGVPVLNKGVAGQQSFELLARFDADVVALRPRAVVIWGFANDVFRADRARADDAMTRMRQSVTAMIAQARAAGIEPILATEVTIREPNTWSDWFAGWAGWALGKTSYQAYVNSHILAQNAWLRDTANRERLLILDLQPVIGEPGGRRYKDFAADDGSHINDAGYAALTAYAEPHIAARLAPRGPR
jgi:uncharacterized SAM-binding protein YcdF (DUF218 family)/lysophospholipase L1-like esterase